MLEWPKLCEQVSRFASTHAGKRACRALVVPEEPSETLRLLEQTRAIITLEYDWATALDYGGIQTSEAESGLGRADKGAMMSPQQLMGVVSLVTGAERLRKQVVVAARENDALRPDSPARLLLAAVGRLRPQPHLVRAVGQALDEDGNIQDSASEPLRILRIRVKALQSRLASMLKGYGGEVSDKGGRMCVAVAAGTKIPNGVLLGSAPGGGLQYVEPAAVVGLNNELGAARAEAQAAEEAVLWDLTGLVMGSLDELQDTFRTVAWLDVLSARARYGAWIDGILPEIVPWDKVFHARGAAAMRRRARGGVGFGEEDGDNGEASVGYRDPDERYAVRLRGLRHPLLYGEYLTQKESLEREVRMMPSGGSGNSAGADTAYGMGGGGGGGRRRMLGTRKEVLLQRAGLGSGGSRSGSDADETEEEADTPQAALAALRPPRPVDWVVRPDTSVVVITGPNTGGKTAAMKALGLAACMAKSGLPLPAEAPARLPAFTSVLADIGDEQSLTANLSTFSGHLRRIQSLRAEADGKALLLLDELGTGTDPLEGAALGVALLKKLVNGGVGSGALTVATTHHSVMTGLKFDDPRFENASVEFDEAALAPTYKLLWGIPGRSNALNIAARLGLDPSVVSAARARLDVGVASVNSSIEQLEALRGQLETEEAATWQLDKEVKLLTKRLKAISARVEELHDTLSRARAEALLQVYSLARDRIREIKQAKKRLGKGAPKPQPILAEPAATPAAAPATAATPSSQAAPTDTVVAWPSEEEVWEAWEAANQAQQASETSTGVSAAAMGAPAPPGGVKPAARAWKPGSPPPVAPPVPPPVPQAASVTSMTAAATAATSSPPPEATSRVRPLAAADPLRELLALDDEAGIDDLIDSLAAQDEQRRAEALREEEEEDELYDTAISAMKDLMDAQQRKQQLQREQREREEREELERRRRAAELERQQRQQAATRKSGRARAAARAADAAAAAEEADDADLTELLQLLDESEAKLNARMTQQQQQQEEERNAGANGLGSGGAGGAQGGSGEEDLDLESLEVVQLLESVDYEALRALQQQQERELELERQRKLQEQQLLLQQQQEQQRQLELQGGQGPQQQHRQQRRDPRQKRQPQPSKAATEQTERVQRQPQPQQQQQPQQRQQRSEPRQGRQQQGAAAGVATASTATGSGLRDRQGRR